MLTLLIGLLADVVNYNRQLIELTLERVRRMEVAIGTARDADRSK